jgi:hypothetical protein
VTVFIIERQLEKAAWFAPAGALPAFFGFVHGEQIGVGQSPVVALSYFVAGMPVRLRQVGCMWRRPQPAKRCTAAAQWRPSRPTSGVRQHCEPADGVAAGAVTRGRREVPPASAAARCRP